MQTTQLVKALCRHSDAALPGLAYGEPETCTRHKRTRCWLQTSASTRSAHAPTEPTFPTTPAGARCIPSPAHEAPRTLKWTKLLATRSGGQRSGQRLLARTASRKDSADVISCSTEPAWILNTHTYARVRNMKVHFHARLIHLLVTVCVGRRLSQGGVLVARNTFTLATAREAKGTTEGAGAAVEAHVPWRT